MRWTALLIAAAPNTASIQETPEVVANRYGLFLPQDNCCFDIAAEPRIGCGIEHRTSMGAGH